MSVKIQTGLPLSQYCLISVFKRDQGRLNDLVYQLIDEFIDQAEEKNNCLTYPISLIAHTAGGDLARGRPSIQMVGDSRDNLNTTTHTLREGICEI